MTQESLKAYRDENTREIEMPDGSSQQVRMTPHLWKDLEFLRLVENLQEPELAEYAIEEARLQQVSFEKAFRAVVTHFADRWT